MPLPNTRCLYFMTPVCPRFSQRRHYLPNKIWFILADATAYHIALRVPISITDCRPLALSEATEKSAQKRGRLIGWAEKCDVSLAKCDLWVRTCQRAPGVPDLTLFLYHRLWSANEKVSIRTVIMWHALQKCVMCSTVTSFVYYKSLAGSYSTQFWKFFYYQAFGITTLMFQ